MSYSKGWFRRRRPAALDDGPGGRVDPFLNESALELGFGPPGRTYRPAGDDGTNVGLADAPAWQPPDGRLDVPDQSGRPATPENAPSENAPQEHAAPDHPQPDVPSLEHWGRRDAPAPIERLERPDPADRLDRWQRLAPAEKPEIPDRPEGLGRAERRKRDAHREAPAPPDTAEPTPERDATPIGTVAPAFPRRDRADNRPRFAFVTPGARPNGPALHDAFTPTRPQQEGGSFAGRAAEMHRIIAAIEEERAHVVISGEHGSGRTSLLNMLAAKASAAGYAVARLSCSSAADFDDIARGLLRRLPAGLAHSPADLAQEQIARPGGTLGTLADLVPAHRLGVADCAALFAGMRDRRAILMLDEVDRLATEVRRELAEFAKALSDAGAPVTLLLVGLSEDVPRLFADHPSLRRTMVTVPLPPLADEDIGAILAAGEAKTGLRFDDAARRSIVDLAQGLPYPAHLLALFATHSAAARQSRRVETQDLRDAARRIGDDPTFLLKIAYDRALGDEPGDETEDLLFFAARSRTNVTGTFDAAAIAAAAAAGQKDGAGNAVTRLSLLSLHHALDGLTEPDRGPVLCRVAGLIEPAYRFTSEMMRAYVLIRQAERRGLI